MLKAISDKICTQYACCLAVIRPLIRLVVFLDLERTPSGYKICRQEDHILWSESLLGMVPPVRSFWHNSITRLSGLSIVYALRVGRYNLNHLYASMRTITTCDSSLALHHCCSKDQVVTSVDQQVLAMCMLNVCPLTCTSTKHWRLYSVLWHREWGVFVSQGFPGQGQGLWSNLCWYLRECLGNRVFIVLTLLPILQGAGAGVNLVSSNLLPRLPQVAVFLHNPCQDFCVS